MAPDTAACNCDASTDPPTGHRPWCGTEPTTAASIPYEGTDCTADEAVEAVEAVRKGTGIHKDPATGGSR